MPFDFKLPGQTKENKKTTFSPDPEKQRAGLGSAKNDTRTFDDIKSKEQTPEETLRFDNMQEVQNAFKKGSIDWPENIEVEDLKYVFYKSFTKGFVNILKGKRPGYVIYHIPKEHLSKAQKKNMGHWMVFLFKPEGPSIIVPQGIGFTSSQRGSVIYEDQQVVGDVVLLKLQLPSGVIALKGKVDTGADISSLHVDSTPKIVGDTVRFQNHNASGNVITAPLVAKQAVKNSEGVEYRPVIELDIEVNGKKISKAQFNLNNRSNMEHEVLIGQNILEKGGFLVNPTQDKVQEGEEETDLMDLNEDEIDDLMMQFSEFLTESEEDNTED